MERQGELHGERDSSLESSETPRGQEETGVGGPVDPEMYQLGGRQLYLGPGPSTKGPNSTPRIVCVKVREPKEEADYGGTSPRRKPTAYKNPGKATKRPSPPANPGIAVEG